MNFKLDSIIKKFPLVYSQHACIMTNDGWYSLIYNLSKDLHKLILQWKENEEKNPDPEDICVCTHQRFSHPKEKWIHECSLETDIDGYCDCKYICSNFTLAVPKINEIKQKFGFMRISFSFYIPGMREIERDYELLSEYICELCGEPGGVKNNKGWYTTICNTCFSTSH